MGNQRKKGKKKYSFWLTEAEGSLLKEMAEIEEINMTDVFRTLLIEKAKKKGILSNAKGK